MTQKRIPKRPSRKHSLAWYELHGHRQNHARRGGVKPGRGWSRGAWFKGWLKKRHGTGTGAEHG